MNNRLAAIETDYKASAVAEAYVQWPDVAGQAAIKAGVGRKISNKNDAPPGCQDATYAIEQWLMEMLWNMSRENKWHSLGARIAYAKVVEVLEQLPYYRTIWELKKL